MITIKNIGIQLIKPSQCLDFCSWLYFSWAYGIRVFGIEIEDAEVMKNLNEYCKELK